MKIKKHLTDEELIELAYEKLNISNVNVDKLFELANKLDLIFDGEKGMYLNPKWLDPEEFLSEKWKHIPKEQLLKTMFGFSECTSFIDEYTSNYE
jgi:hypothetical protein